MSDRENNSGSQPLQVNFHGGGSDKPPIVLSGEFDPPCTISVVPCHTNLTMADVVLKILESFPDGATCRRISDGRMFIEAPFIQVLCGQDGEQLDIEVSYDARFDNLESVLAIVEQLKAVASASANAGGVD